ncbi:hypothetical protein [Peristeroidobacter soli]|uniref:hypothetical protein n=1 Tax=Peristeroidobacter soli TaxID=2497877 RepID=UPI00101D0EFC|nr:hypothetical protein [Peristeroidobacter soli]
MAYSLRIAHAVENISRNLLVNLYINSSQPMDEYHSGSSLTIWLWEGAEASWAEAEVGVMEAHQAQFRARLARLAEFGRLRVPDHMNSEGDGIHAVKGNTGLRAYGWFDRVSGRRAFIISHVVLKKKQKLDPADLAKASARKDSYRLSKESK